jgi:23S rRNA pseudouridine2605 synthase
MFEHLQKTISQAGYGSLQECEEFIVAGRVRVNGQLAVLDQIVDPALDEITIDRTPIAELPVVTPKSLAQKKSRLPQSTK